MPVDFYGITANLQTPEGVLAFAHGATHLLQKYPKDRVMANGALLPTYLFLNGFEIVDSFKHLYGEEYAGQSTIIGDLLDACLVHYGPTSVPTLRGLFRGYYDLRCQQQHGGQRFHKGKELYHEGLCLQALGLEDAAAKSVALALIEDTLTFPTEDEVKRSNAFVYLSSRVGRPSTQRLVEMALEAKRNDHIPKYPEMILDLASETDQLLPSLALRVPFRVNLSLLAELRREAELRHKPRREEGERNDGKAWELVAQYLLASVDGIQLSKRRELGPGAEHDLVFRIPDPHHPLAPMFGNYLVVEAKDWSKPVDAKTIRDFLGKLTSLEVRAGILFTRTRVTGRRDSANGGWLEILKAYHRHHVIIIVLDDHHIDLIEQGENLVSLLMRAYQRVRFDTFLVADE